MEYSFVRRKEPMRYQFAARAAWMGILAAGAILPGQAPAQNSSQFDPPVRLRAGGAFIDHGTSWGHCGPTMADVDGDGKKDLVVGDFGGKFHFYRNVGANTKPEFAPGRPLMVGKDEAKV